MNTDLRKKAKNDLEEDFFKLINMEVFRKTMVNVRQKQRYQTCHNRKKKKLSDVRTNYHTAKFFTENVLAIEMKKAEILMNKPANLVLSILELSTNL